MSKTVRVPLGEVCAINPPLSQRVSADDKCSFVPMDAVDEISGTIANPSIRTVSDVQRGYTPFENGDVIFAKITPCMENGKCAIARRLRGGIAYGSTEFHVFRASPRVLVEWVHFFLRQSEVRTRAAQRMTGSAGQQRVPETFFDEIEIPLPPLDEQRRLAVRLARAERLRRTRRFALQLSDTFLQSVFVEMFGDPLENPKHWNVVRVEEAGRVQLGRQRAPKYQTGRFRKPYIRVANVYENEIDLSDLLYMDFDASDFASYRLSYSDILLNEGQSVELVGRPAMWRGELAECCFQNTLIRFQADRSVCEPEYALWLFLQYLHLGEFAKVSVQTSNVAHLGASRLAVMPFPLPPLARQKRFATLVTRFERHRTRLREAERQADHLFQRLLADAFAA